MKDTSATTKYEYEQRKIRLTCLEIASKQDDVQLFPYTYDLIRFVETGKLPSEINVTPKQEEG